MFPGHLLSDIGHTHRTMNRTSFKAMPIEFKPKALELIRFVDAGNDFYPVCFAKSPQYVEKKKRYKIFKNRYTGVISINKLKKLKN